MYAELVYFEGAHFAHVVMRDEHYRLKRLLACSGFAQLCSGRRRFVPTQQSSQAGRVSRQPRRLALVT